MATLTNLDGVEITFNPSAVVAISDHDDTTGDAHTWVFGISGGRTLIAESVDAFMQRLKIANDFAKLTRPDGWPVWIRGSAVSTVLAAEPSDAGLPTVKPIKSIVKVGSLRQAVAEIPADAIAALNAHGANL